MDHLDGFSGVSKTAKWKTFTLTHVDYPENDLFGAFLAVTSLMPWIIAVAFIAVFCVKRDLHTFFYGIGIIMSEGINYVLKKIIREPRPASLHGVRDSEVLSEKFGMPSSHTQYMWFVSTYMVLFVFIRLKHQESLILKSLWCALCVSVSSLVAYGRIYLHYHTVSQVAWGIVAGSTLAAIWFIIVHFLLTPCFPTITSWRLSEFFMIRDYTPIPNVIWFDYYNARSEAKNRFRKLSKSKKQ